MAFDKIDRMITGDNGDVFYEFSSDGHQILYYMPHNEVRSNLINYGFTGPTFLVFPDRKTDFQGLRAAAEETGLLRVAKEEGVGIILVNPQGESFEGEEPGAYEAVTANLGIAQENFRDGLAIMKNEILPDEQRYNILGACVRMYVYGFGSGADYLAKYYLRKVEGSAVLGDLGHADLSMVSVTLSGLSVLPAPSENDLHIVSVGNPEEAERILRESGAEVLVREDTDLYRDFYEFAGCWRRWTGKVLPAYNYASEGIIAKAESVMLPISDDNEIFRRRMFFLRTKEHRVGYVTFYDKNLDIEHEKHPLMLVFHGGGDSAYATASLAEWPEIGQREGFITVAVEMHLRVSAKEVAALIDHLKEEYAIDETRIYATGFSMGGIKSWDLFEQCPERFAALLPMDAIDYVGNNCFGAKTDEVNQKTMVPLFYIGGVDSFGVELPMHHERAIERLQYVAKVNRLTKRFDVRLEDKESWEDPLMAVAGDRTEVLHDPMFPESVYTAHYYDSEDGKCYTCLLGVTHHAHEIRPFTNNFAWNFVKKFKRNPDGSIGIDE